MPSNGHCRKHKVQATRKLSMKMQHYNNIQNLIAKIKFMPTELLCATNSSMSRVSMANIHYGHFLHN